jgi:hypothetical protein
MTKFFDEIIARVRKLPAEEQDAAAGALLDYLDGMGHLRLSDEQLAEVRRRRATRDGRNLTLAEVGDRILRART